MRRVVNIYENTWHPTCTYLGRLVGFVINDLWLLKSDPWHSCCFWLEFYIAGASHSCAHGSHVFPKQIGLLCVSFSGPDLLCPAVGEQSMTVTVQANLVLSDWFQLSLACWNNHLHLDDQCGVGSTRHTLKARSSSSALCCRAAFWASLLAVHS